MGILSEILKESKESYISNYVDKEELDKNNNKLRRLERQIKRKNWINGTRRKR